MDALAVGAGAFDLGLSLTPDAFRGSAEYRHRMSESWSAYAGAFTEYKRAGPRYDRLNYGASFGLRGTW